MAVHLLLAFSVALSTREPIISGPSTPMPPSKDPWYSTPDNFEQAAPGTILRIRHAPGNLTSIVGSNCSAAYNILYRTTDSQYKPSWSVTTLFAPSIQPGSTNRAGSSVLSYQFPYNSVDVDSSPSYAVYSTPWHDLTYALGHGWFVNVPDFEGPLASDVAAIEEAHAVLDSFRAIMEAGVGAAPDARLALWGYSGGSIASEWALEFQEQYAPELNIIGAALGGLVPNTTYVFDTVGDTEFASHGMAGLLGVTSQYPAAYSYIISQLKTSGPYNKTGFLSIRNMTYEQAHATFANQNMYDYFVGGRAVMQAPLVKRALQLNTIMTYHGVPQTPLFIYKAIHDEVTPVNQTDDYVHRSCSLGVNILYERNTVGGHEDEFVNGEGRALAWLETVLDGSYEQHPISGCEIRNVSVSSVNTGI
jgi:hypothetical protein